MTTNEVDSSAEAERHVGSLIENASNLKDKAKAKTRALFHKDDADESGDDIFQDPAFDPENSLNTSSNDKTSPREQVTAGFDDFKYLLLHPRRVIRSTVTRSTASKIGKARHPVQKLKRDEALLDAYEDLADAASGGSGSGSSICEDDIKDACNRIDKVESQRESLQTAWILGRHVNRVKVVRPVSQPRMADFQKHRFEWERYLGKMALYHSRGFTSHYIDHFDSPRFDLEDLARIIDRMAIISAPFQAFIMKVRQVYTWEDPKTTAKWLVLFSFLWYTEHIVGFFYFWIIYHALHNKFRPTSVETIRSSVTRAADRESKVQAWGELIQRHGKQDWIEPLLDELGPLIQLQLGDLTNFMEVLINFYRHERPDKSLASLLFFSCCLLITLVADMAFCVKLVWLIIGSGFFFTFPIATRLPKYRLLVSPWRWMFWDIPTHAELAILNLQEKAVIRDANLKEFEYEERDDEEKSKYGGETYRFKVYHELFGSGTLIINREGLSFQSTRDENICYHHPFWTLDEILKLDLKASESTLHNVRKLRTRAAESMQFKFIASVDEDGNELAKEKELTLLLHPADRERAFNLTLAWSELKWQSLQIERPEKEGRGQLDQAIKRAFY